jgi:hypothetical protein
MYKRATVNTSSVFIRVSGAFSANSRLMAWINLFILKGPCRWALARQGVDAFAVDGSSLPQRDEVALDTQPTI